MTPDHINLLMAEEDIRPRLYDDATGKPIGPGSIVKGNPTIGVGRNLNRPLSRPEIVFLLVNDIKDTEALLQPFAWWTSLNQARRDVITDMAFNMGISHFLKFQRLIAALTFSNFSQAADEMLDSTWAKQEPTRSLTLANIMRS